MKYLVTSDRLAFPRGSEVDEADLSGNIAVLVQVGHLAPVAGKKAKMVPVQPDPVGDDSAEEPEEQD